MLWWYNTNKVNAKMTIYSFFTAQINFRRKWLCALTNNTPSKMSCFIDIHYTASAMLHMVINYKGWVVLTVLHRFSWHYSRNAGLFSFAFARLYKDTILSSLLKFCHHMLPWFRAEKIRFCLTRHFSQNILYSPLSVCALTLKCHTLSDPSHTTF